MYMISMEMFFFPFLSLTSELSLSRFQGFLMTVALKSVHSPLHSLRVDKIASVRKCVFFLDH